jgi:hypothetical protein
VKDFVSSRKLELDGKRWSEGGYAHGFDFNYARDLFHETIPSESQFRLYFLA